MADPATVRDAIMRRENARHTEELRIETANTRLEVAIDRQRRKVEKLEDRLDEETMILRALEAQRSAKEGK